jgi:pimeloyl-ACP methyl ester carboxylesterase
MERGTFFLSEPELKMENRKSVYIKSNGIRFHCLTAGDGPLCLCLHGFPDTRRAWRHQMGLLARAYQVVVPDMRGYGETDAPREVNAYRLPVLIEDVRGLIEAFGHQEAVLVSHDWGGVVAIHFAQTYPATITRLVVSNAPHLGDYADLIFRKRRLRQIVKIWYVVLNQMPFLSETLLAMRDFWLLEKIVRFYARRPEALTPEVMAEWKDILRISGLRGGVNYYRASFWSPVDYFRNRLPNAQIQCPVQVIWGENDRSLEPELVQMLAIHVSGPFSVHFVKNCGHWVPQEAPEEFNAVLAEFLGVPPDQLK